MCSQETNMIYENLMMHGFQERYNRLDAVSVNLMYWHYDSKTENKIN